MIRIFKNLKKRDWIGIMICAGLVVVQVWLDLTMPDYTQKLSKSVSAGSIVMNEVWKNGRNDAFVRTRQHGGFHMLRFFAARIAAKFRKDAP